MKPDAERQEKLRRKITLDNVYQKLAQIGNTFSIAMLFNYMKMRSSTNVPMKPKCPQKTG